MSEIAVIAESSCNLPPELVQQFGIHILPLRLCWQGESLRDGLDISAEEVYRRQDTEDYTPRTATISPGELLEAVNSLVGQAEAAVAVLLSSKLTSSVEVAHLVRAMDPAIPLHVVDSRTAAMAQGFVTLAAARAAREGAGVESVVQQAQAMIGRVHFFAVLDTLKYLRRLGRVSLPVALAASALQIKPLIALRPGHGQVSSAGRPRTWPRAQARMLDLVAREAAGRPMHAAVSHGNRPESAEEVAAKLRARCDVRELYINHLTPVMGAAAGPTVAITFYADGT